MTDGDTYDAPTGEGSRPGRTLLVAGLCRRLADRGVSVAPFKAQNMSNNARAVPRSEAVPGFDSDPAAAGGDGSVFGEVGVSQYVQARAAFVRRVFDSAGRARPAVESGSESGDSRAEDPYDRAATLVAEIPLDAVFGADAPVFPESAE